MIFREEIGDGVRPFEGSESVRVGEGFVQVFCHQSGFLQSVKIVVDEGIFGIFVNRGGFSGACGDLLRAPIVAFGDGEAGGGDRVGDAETAGEGAGESGFAGANVADKFEDEREFLSL